MSRLIAPLATAAILTLPVFATGASISPGAVWAQDRVSTPGTKDTAPRAACVNTVHVSTILRSGHQDLRLMSADRLVIRHEASHDYESGSVAFAVPDSALTNEIVDGIGTVAYFLPQTQDYNLPWLGFSTEDTDLEARISFAQVEGPGQILAWHNDLSGDTALILDSGDPNVDYSFAARKHDHVNWAFSEPGAYRVTFEFATEMGTATYTTVFLVGDAAIAEGEAGSVEVPCASASASGTYDPNDPRSIAKDLNELSREFTKLDTAWGGLHKAMDSLLPEGTGATTTSGKKPTPARPAQSATKKSATGSATPPRTNGATPAAVKPAAVKPAAVKPAAATPAPRNASKTAPKTAPKAPLSTSTTKASATSAQGGQSASTQAHGSSPIVRGRGPADATALAAQQTEVQPMWQSGHWWAGLTMGMGIASLVAGLLFFLSARRLIADARPAIKRGEHAD